MADGRPQTPPLLPRTKQGSDPKLIGQWKTGRTIGRGCSGRVKIARHTKSGGFAAVKIVSKNALINSRASFADMENDLERILTSLQREIVIMKLIDHPNILKMYDVWQTPNTLYLILEYVEGGELFDYICERGKLPTAEALNYFQQIIGAVNYCHRFNIAHRDLKPENLLLDRKRNIKVADFGMAAWQGGGDLLETSCGSPHYAAPEVVNGQAYDGCASDIWSCGVILFALLAGRLPFDDEDIGMLLEKVKLATYTMPNDIDPGARDLISKMLQKDVKDRISMAAILAHPWFNSAKPKYAHCQPPSLEQIAKPVSSAADIDPELMKNMRTLWHGAPEEAITEGLLNDQDTWEKLVYTLLVEFRDRDPETYQKRSISGRRKPSNHNRKPPPKVDQHDGASRTAEAHVEIPARPDPPTPRRGMQKHVTQAVAPNGPPPLPLPPNGLPFDVRSRLTHVKRDLPSSPLSFPAPEEVASAPTCGSSEAPVQADTMPSPDIVLSPQPPASQIPMPDPVTAPTSPVWDTVDLPPIDEPELQDENVQRFFQQIVDHLNMMQLSPHTMGSPALPQMSPRMPGLGLASPAMEGMPNLDAAAAAIACGSDFEFVTGAMCGPPPNTPAIHPQLADDTEGDINKGTAVRRRSGTVHDHDKQAHIQMGNIHGLGIAISAPQSPQRTQQVGGGLRRLLSKRKASAEDKENGRRAKGKVDVVPSSAPVGVLKKSSLKQKSADKAREDHGGTLGERKVQILLPADANPKTSPILSTPVPSSPFADADEMAGQKHGSWFANLLKSKPSHFHLLSMFDATTSQEECRRILRSFGCSVLYTDQSGHGYLKCRLDDLRDHGSSGGISAVTKSVQFRVEINPPTEAQSVVGYVTVATLVLEKGSVPTFKQIYNRLRREWDFDGMRSPPVGDGERMSMTPQSPVVGRFSEMMPVDV